MKKNGKLPAVAFGNQEVIHLDDEGRERMIAAVAAKVGEIFDEMRVDWRKDHNTRDTPTRYAKMLVNETMGGRFAPPPEITDFDNVSGFSNLIVTGPIELRSACAHHLMPVYGSAYIGVLPAPKGKIIGLSKYDRIVHHFSARLQIQEELVKQIGDYINACTKPAGLAVRISAVHMCKTHRGVKATHAAKMVTSEWYGKFRTDAALKAEFLNEVAHLENHRP